MRSRPIYVIDLIRDLVTATNTAVIAELQAVYPTIQAINFIPGTEGEINEVLTVMSQQASKDGKQWPLFGLLFSFPIDRNTQVGIDGDADVNLLIARRGNNTDLTPARYDNNFKPVLYPIAMEFLNQVYLSPKFNMPPPEMMSYRWVDYPYYDTEKGENVFNSFVDAIQIKIKLKILLARC